MQYTKEKILQRRKEMALLTQQGYTVSKIAEKYGITRQAVSQLLQKAALDGHKVVLRKCGSRLNKNKNYEYRPTLKEVGFVNKCIICENSFSSKLKTTKTCGDSCKRLLLHKKLLEAKGTLGNWSRYENVQLTCYNCGKAFERSKYRDSISKLGCGTKNSYCSRNCYHEKSRKQVEVVKSYKGQFWPSLEDYQKKLSQNN